MFFYSTGINILVDEEDEIWYQTYVSQIDPELAPPKEEKNSAGEQNNIYCSCYSPEIKIVNIYGQDIKVCTKCKKEVSA